MDELKRRLILRDANISKEEIELRLNRFEYEESKTDIYDYVITNNNLEKSFKIIKTIIEEEKKI